MRSGCSDDEAEFCACGDVPPELPPVHPDYEVPTEVALIVGGGWIAFVVIGTVYVLVRVLA